MTENNKEKNIIQDLLNFNVGDLTTPKKDFTMALKKLGGEYTFPIQAIDPEVMSELQENLIKMNAKSSDVSMKGSYHKDCMVIIEGCPKVFKNDDIKRHFNAATPKELVKKMLLSGEIKDLTAEIEKLSGYEPDEDKKEEVKN